jgi:GH15 family glucan-1,4-alpha-glucosidase
VSDSLVYRYNPRASPDGVRGAEGTFLGVLVLVRRGARPCRALDEARLAFEKMLTCANHVGLYAEQISRAGQQQGNFPPGADHLALISAAFNLDRVLGA